MSFEFKQASKEKIQFFEKIGGGEAMAFMYAAGLLQCPKREDLHTDD